MRGPAKLAEAVEQLTGGLQDAIVAVEGSAAVPRRSTSTFCCDIARKVSPLAVSETLATVRAEAERRAR